MTPAIIQYIGYGILILCGFLGIGGATAIAVTAGSRARRAELAEAHQRRLELAEKTGEVAQILLVDKEMAEDVRKQLNDTLAPPPPPALPAPKTSIFGRLAGSVARALTSGDDKPKDP